MEINWIDVKKKLPDDDNTYLVCGSGYDLEKKIGRVS